MAPKTQYSHMVRIFILFVLQFFYIVLHAFYTDATCLNANGLTYMKCTSKPLIYLKSGEKLNKTQYSHMMKIFILFVLQFFYIVFHVLYTDATCLNGYVYIYIKGRSKSLIYLKSGGKCEKTRPIHALRNHFLVLQFFAIFSFVSFAIVFHIFYTGATCINEYVCRHTY